MKPTVCRSVHYVSHGTPVREDGTQAYPPKCRAAIVTEVIDCDKDHDGCSQPCVSLAVLNPTGFFFPEHISHDDPFPNSLDPATRLGGTWHWPEFAPVTMTELPKDIKWA